MSSVLAHFVAYKPHNLLLLERLVLQRRAVTSRRRYSSALVYSSGTESLRIAAPLIELKFTNQIQREFLFNVAIATQNIFLASSLSRQKTNHYKPSK
jgi:hypothetical protein